MFCDNPYWNKTTLNMTLNTSSMETEKNILNSSKPRAATNADATGKYELIAQASNLVANSGDEVTIDLYITGYGKISDGKIYFSLPSTSVNGQVSSTVTHGIKFLNSEAFCGFTWGNVTDEFTSSFVLGLNGGIQVDEWPETTMFFDSHTSASDHKNNIILTEELLGGEPPFRVKVNFNKRSKPGVYNVSCILTYFNGESWQNSSLQLGIVIRTIFQQYEGWVSFLGILAALGSSTGIVALAIQLWSLLHPGQPLLNR